MLKHLSDPYIVLKFQNFCGLTKTSTVKGSSVETSAVPGKEFGCGSDLISATGDGPRARKVVDQNQGSQVFENDPMSEESKLEEELQYNPYLHGLYFFGSSLGDEAFYMTFFPYLLWNVDEYVGRRLIILWGIMMYVGQGLKDILRWPRPPSPPVIVVERRYESEYGMPSTHATVGTLVPFTLVYFTYGRFEYPFYLGVAFVIFWCGLVCLSRIYMGVHSFQDLVGGVSLAVMMLAICLPFLDETLEHYLAEPYIIIPLIVIPALMIYLYPQHTVWTSSRRETARVVGTSCGVLVGFACTFSLDGVPIIDPYAGVPYPYNFTTRAVFVCLAKFILGVVLLVLVKVVTKFLLVRTLLAILPHSGKKLEQNSMVDIPALFMIYANVGFFAAYVARKVFNTLGLVI